MQAMSNDRLIRFLNQLSYLVEKTTNIPCVILGGSMVVTVISGVIARYIMQNPMVWTEEVARFFMNWMALLGVSIATRHRAHLGVVFFVSKLPLGVQRMFKLVSDSLILVFLYFLTVYGFEMVAGAKLQIEPSTGISMNYPLLCVPLCGILTMIQLSLQMLMDIFRSDTKESFFQV